MSTFNKNEYYKKYVNLYRTPLTEEHVTNAIPHPDWIICSLIGPPDELKSAGGIILDSAAASKKTPPLIYRVIKAGTSATELLNLSTGDFIAIQFLAGDKFLDSNVVLIHKDDVLMRYYPGDLVNKHDSKDITQEEV